MIHRRSLQREPVHGGGRWVIHRRLLQFLVPGCALWRSLPTVCASVLFLHPELVEISGITVNPLVLIVVGPCELVEALLSQRAFSGELSSFLFALVEKAPAERARREMTQTQSLGWTEQDAKSSPNIGCQEFGALAA